jgi:2-polyprenyl-6-methoxyphenol hydroxylase-like FAD-dependent oxidoreductase
MHELGFLKEFLDLPHQPVSQFSLQFNKENIAIANFSRLPVHCKFIAMMPQWNFLNFISTKARACETFQLLMQAEATALIQDHSGIKGLHVDTPNGPIEVYSDLVVAADGRSSVLRQQSGLFVEDFGAPMDALWFRLSRKADDTDQTQGRIDAGQMLVMLNRGEYWQCAYIIPKGTFETLRSDGLVNFLNHIGELLPFDSTRVNEISDWEQVKLLVVQVNRLKTWWRKGFLCIGDAAHAMSPIGGVGVNLAVQDAVATANLLSNPLKNRSLQLSDLAAVQKRRNWPTRMTQRLQLMLQNTIIAPTLNHTREMRPPLALRIITKIPILNRLPARFIGLGVRPEHIQRSG